MLVVIDHKERSFTFVFVSVLQLEAFNDEGEERSLQTLLGNQSPG